jgi:SNF2-related domain
VALKTYSILKSKGLVDCMLVIAPLRVIVTSWPQEINRWQDFDHLTYKIVHGGQLNRRKALESKADVYLMNVEGLIGTEFKPIARNPHAKRKVYDPNPYATGWFAGKRVMLVADESTMFKDSKALRSQSLKCYLPMTNRRVVMTGTPRPGKLENLFFQCYITDLGKDLGRFITHFRNAYMRPDKSGFGYEELPGANEAVALKIAPTTIVSEGDDDMPTMEVPVWVPMPPELRAQYNELKREFLLVLGNSVVMAPNAGVLWGKLRQFCQGAIFDTMNQDPDKRNAERKWLLVHEGKLDALEGILNELDGEPAFCLYAYRHDFARINQRLEYEVPRVGGGVSLSQGRANCMLFGAGEIPLMLGHPASVARGIDGLQNNCRNVIWFGNDPSWEATYQANLRIARHGSKADCVTIYRIMLDCSVERTILETCRNKELNEEGFLNLLREML